jgi:hypothetical protein
VQEDKMEHDVHDFVRRAQNELHEEYLRIRKRAAEDPGTAGDQGEENWATLFREWLPRYFQVVTKGRILTDSGYVSPQVDLLVLYPSYPNILLDKKLYLSGGVAAAFECKTTVTAGDVKKAVETSAALRQALPRRYGTPYKERHSGVIYGLLAHSHSWQRAGSDPIANIQRALCDADAQAVCHPRESIDFITVSDLAAWHVTKLTYLSPLRPGYEPDDRRRYGPDGTAGTAYICHAIGADRQEDYFSPVGSLLSGLFSALAWDFPDMRPLEDYFRQLRLSGSGEGHMRTWGIDIYSELIRDRVYRGDLSNGVLAIYDQWRIAF